MTSFVRVYKIDSNSDMVEDVKTIPKNFEDYSMTMISENGTRKNSREYVYQENSVNTKPLIDNLRENIKEQDMKEKIFIDVCEKFSNLLLIAQKELSERYPIVTLKEGNVIFYLNEEGFLIAKIDRSGYFNGDTYQHEVGLPEEKAVQKIAYFQFNEDDEVTITLSDSNPSISTFWFDTFLELRAINNNEKNTKNAFNMIWGFINRQVTKVSKADGTELINSLIGYFRNNEFFSMTDVKDQLFDHYQPLDSNVKMEEIKKNFENQCKKVNFDTQFQIAPDIIRKRIKKTYKIKDNMELKTDGYIEDIRKNVVAIRDDEGRFYLKILNVTEEAYDNFRR